MTTKEAIESLNEMCSQGEFSCYNQEAIEVLVAAYLEMLNATSGPS